MSKIKLAPINTFTLIPEGQHIFKITAVKYKDAYGKLEVSMETADGLKHIERFQFLNNGGGQNEGAIKAFSYFGRVALNDITVDEIDPDDLVGHYIEADVEHQQVPSTKNPGEMFTFVKLGDKRPAAGFAVENSETAPVKEVQTKPFDLDDLLG